MDATSPIKSYGRTELAQMYFPRLTAGAAWRKLRSWMTLCSPLMAELERLGYAGGRRTFTPAEVAAIFEYIGEP